MKRNTKPDENAPRRIREPDSLQTGPDIVLHFYERGPRQ